LQNTFASLCLPDMAPGRYGPWPDIAPGRPRCGGVSRPVDTSSRPCRADVRQPRDLSPDEHARVMDLRTVALLAVSVAAARIGSSTIGCDLGLIHIASTAIACAMMPSRADFSAALGEGISMSRAREIVGVSRFCAARAPRSIRDVRYTVCQRQRCTRHSRIIKGRRSSTQRASKQQFMWALILERENGTVPSDRSAALSCVPRFMALCPGLSSCARTRDRDEVMCNDAPADVSLESDGTFVPRTRHPEAMFQRADACFDASSPTQGASEPALFLELSTRFGESSAGG
jgi:hypothetical protein